MSCVEGGGADRWNAVLSDPERHGNAFALAGSAGGWVSSAADSPVKMGNSWAAGASTVGRLRAGSVS